MRITRLSTVHETGDAAGFHAAVGRNPQSAIRIPHSARHLSSPTAAADKCFAECRMPNAEC
jgi:hypothetical protein